MTDQAIFFHFFQWLQTGKKPTYIDIGELGKRRPIFKHRSKSVFALFVQQNETRVSAKTIWNTRVVLIFHFKRKHLKAIVNYWFFQAIKALWSICFRYSLWSMQGFFSDVSSRWALPKDTISVNNLGHLISLSNVSSSELES